MAFSFNMTKTLADTNQIRIVDDVAPNLIKLSIKVGANPIQSVSMTSTEAEDVRNLLGYLVRSKMIDPT